MNSFGRIFRVNIFGESHGPWIGVCLDGCPPGIPISENDFEVDLNRRRGAVQEGTTSRKEADNPQIVSGIFNGCTTGAPIVIQFENTSARSEDYLAQRPIPRPGHADFVASKKFKGFEDYRGGGHFSGRLTVCMVAAGVVAKKILASQLPVDISARVTTIAGNSDLDAAIASAIKNQDSVGGIIECTVNHLPVGWGEPFFDSVESLLSHAVFAIPAIRGIEFGAGFAAAGMTGRMHNDALINEEGITATNHAGGVVGGISNGNPLLFRVAVKPTSSTPAKQNSFNMQTKEREDFQVKGRHDLCIALRVPVVLEAVTACVLADLMLLNK